MNVESIMPILQTNFLLGMKTGNSILDSILSVIILFYAKHLIEYIPKIWKYIKGKILRLGIVKSEYLIQGTISISTEYCSYYCNFPQEYKALMYKIYQFNVDIKHGRQFNKSNRHVDSKTDHSLFSYSLNTEDEIKITDQIYVRQTHSVDKSNDLKCTTEFYNLYIYSYVLPFTELKKIVDEWIKEYNKFVKEYNDGNIYYFSYVGNKDIKPKPLDDKNQTVFESHKFFSNKSFDNVFFDKKDDLISRLDYFLNNEDSYRKLGIPYTLGLLFHGEPGCGKTSTIKAITNYTKRHIVEIPLSKIKTCTELKNIFFDELICNHYVPSDKKIIVLEDIDCMGDIVTKRLDNIPDGEDVLTDEEVEIQKLEAMNKIVNKGKNNNSIYKRILKDEDENDKLNLSYILNLIDGVLEQKGRILIVTTNHPEKLDDALIRPGRVDMKINFTKCSKKVCQDILNFFFGDKMLDNCVNYDKLPDYTLTPAELFQKCLNYNDINKVLDQISE